MNYFPRMEIIGCTAVRQQTGILNKSNTLTFLTTHTQLPCLSFGAGKYFRAIHRLKVVLIKFYNHKTIHSCSNNRYNIWVTCKSPVSTENLEHRALIRSPPHRIRMPDSPINLSDWVSSWLAFGLLFISQTILIAILSL